MIEPRQIIEESDSELSIIWSDEAETKYNAADLRRSCPCAGCINEWTGEKMLKAENIADDLSFSSISIVGRYALNFHFSDGHETGIYSFDYMRKLKH
ncbi:MAG TPA: DUF971 domain-containing protein [Pyrinomonadaceae bacterium]|nr:DUF971 domain-containing protein [Pyrinomonadaceae bacterium]